MKKIQSLLPLDIFISFADEVFGEYGVGNTFDFLNWESEK